MSNNGRDWMPGSHQGKIEMAETWVGILSLKAAAWSIPTTVVERLQLLEEDALDAHKQTASPDATPTMRQRRNRLVADMAAFMRDIKKRYFHMPPLVLEDYATLGLPEPDYTRTVIELPTSQASAEVSYPGPHLLLLHINLLTETLHDPRADYGFRIHYGVMPPGGATLEEAACTRRYLMKEPESGAELADSEFTRERTRLFEFPAVDSGKRAFFCIRVENPKGGKGPWGSVFSAIIP